MDNMSVCPVNYAQNVLMAPPNCTGSLLGQITRAVQNVNGLALLAHGY